MGQKLILRCAVCNRKLKDSESVDRGVGPVCEKKLDREALIEIRESVNRGYQPIMIEHGALQLTFAENEIENDFKAG